MYNHARSSPTVPAHRIVVMLLMCVSMALQGPRVIAHLVSHLDTRPAAVQCVAPVPEPCAACYVLGQLSTTVVPACSPVPSYLGTCLYWPVETDSSVSFQGQRPAASRGPPTFLIA